MCEGVDCFPSTFLIRGISLGGVSDGEVILPMSHRVQLYELLCLWYKDALKLCVFEKAVLPTARTSQHLPCSGGCVTHGACPELWCRGLCDTRHYRRIQGFALEVADTAFTAEAVVQHVQEGV